MNVQDTAGHRVVAVTGASRGLGRALCSEFGRRGFAVAGMSRSEPEDAFTPHGFHRIADVRDADAVDAFADLAVSRFGRIDVWINNAAVMDVFRVADAENERWQRLFDTNIIGTLNGSRAFARHVRDRSGHGTLVNLTAGSAHRARERWAAYAASKAAVERMTEALAVEEEGRLKAFCVSPGAMDTEMQKALWNLPEDVFPEGRELRERAAAGFISSTHVIAARIADEVERRSKTGAPEGEPVYLPYRVP